MVIELHLRVGILALVAIVVHTMVAFGASLTYVVTIESGDTDIHVAAIAQGLAGTSLSLALKGEATYVESFISNLQCGSSTPTDAGQGRWIVRLNGGTLNYEYSVSNTVPWQSNLPWGTGTDIAIYVDNECGLFMAPYLFIFPDKQEITSIRVRFVVPSGWEVVTPFPFDGEYYVVQRITTSLLNDFLNRQQFYMGPMLFYSEKNADGCTVRFGKLLSDENIWELESQEEVDAYADATARTVVALADLYGANPYDVFTMYSNFRREGWTYQGTRYLGNGYQYWPENRWDELVGHAGLAWVRGGDAPLWADVRIEKGIVEDYYGHKLAYELFGDSTYRGKMLLYYYLYEWMSDHPDSASSSYANGISEYEAYVRWEFVGLLLDEIIQERSEGAYSLDNAMRWLFARYANTEYVVGVSDLERAIQTATNADVGDIFFLYIYGDTKLPVYHYMADFKAAFLDYPRVCADAFHNNHYHGHVLPMFIDMVLTGSLSSHIPFGLLYGGYSQMFAETALNRHDLDQLTEKDVVDVLSDLAGQDCSDFFHAWEDSFGVLTIEQVKSWLEDYIDKAQGQTTSLGTRAESRGNPDALECDGQVGSDWDTPMFISTDVAGDAPDPAEDIVALYVRTDATYLHVRLDLAAAAQPSVRYSVNLHPAGSSECYSLHAGGEGMWGPSGFVCQIEYAIGEVVEFAVPLAVLDDFGLSVFDISADSRAFGTGWLDRYDDIRRKNFRLE